MEPQIKRAVYVLGGIVFFGAAVQLPFLVLSQKARQNQKRTLAPLSAVKKESAQPKRLRDFLATPRLAQNEPLMTATKQAELTMDQGCVEFMTAVQRMDLKAFEFPPQPPALATLPQPSQCTNMPTEIAKRTEDFQKNCSGVSEAAANFPTDEQTWHKQSGECVNALFFLRAEISSWNARGTPLSEITDLRILSDRLAATFGRTFRDSSAPNAKEILPVAERILELNPHLYEAVKANLMGRTLAGMEDKSLWDNEQNLARMRELLNQARNTNPEDHGLATMEYAIETRGFDPERVRDVSLKTIETNPENADAHFNLAWAHSRLGKRELAIRELRRALTLDPGNPEYKTALESVIAKDTFSRTLQLGMSFSDLLNQ